MSVRVVVVSDDPLVRGGLAALVTEEAGLTLVGQWTGAAVVAAEEADVAVWDADSPAAFDRMADVQARGLLVLAVLRDSSQATAAGAARVRGIVPRDVSAARLAAAVNAVAEGLVVLDGTAAQALLQPHPDAVLVEPLTAREQEVLQLVAEGLSNKLIAARLGISEHTAKFHVNSILGKLGAQTRAEAVARAARLGLLLL